MKKILLGVVSVAAFVAVLAGCASTGRGHGPVESFAFLAAANPQLPRGAIGAIDERSEPKEIQVVVPPGTDVRGLVATLSFGKEAIVTVVSSGARVVQDNGVTPNDFSVPVIYAIEMPGEKKPWTYRVTVREAQTNARLSTLSVPAGHVLSPGFSPTVHAYTLDVPFAATRVRIEARGQNAGMRSITIDGTETPGPSAAGAVDFQNAQERTITLTTLAEDGVAQEKYTITLRRAPPDSNAFLGGLELTNAPLSPAFNPALLTYQAVVPFETAQLGLKARPQSKVATITLDAAAGMVNGSSTLPLVTISGDPAGSGAQIDFRLVDQLPLVVAVTAEDGSMQQYTLTVVRAAPDRNTLLSDLSLFLDPKTELTIVPPFQSGRFAYAMEVPYPTTRFTLKAAPQSKVATLALEALPSQPNVRPVLTVTGTPGAKNGAIVEFPATQRRLLFAVAVTVQDGSIQRTTVDVRRAAPDSNADLASLSFSVGAMTPGFSPRTASYSLVIPSSAESVTVTAAAARAVAAIGIAELSGVKPAANQSLTIPLAPGASSVVTFVVTAQDGSQKLYRLNVSREAAPTSLDGNALLRSLSIVGAQLTPLFNPSVVQYDAEVAAATASVILNAPAQSPAAVVTIDGQPASQSGRTIALTAGTTRTVSVDVTAQNGAVVRYTVRIKRGSQPTGGSQPDATAQPEKKPSTPPAATPAMPPDTGTDHVVVAATNLRLAAREISALVKAQDRPTGPARITIRYYRSTETIARYAADAVIKQQGSNTAISFAAPSNGVTLDRSRLVEVEVALQTSGGKWLSYAEARPADAEMRLDVPFLLYGDNPQVQWPAIGTMVPVTGYLSSIPSARERAADKEDFGKGVRGDYSVTADFTDAKTGAAYGSSSATVRPGKGRAAVIAFSKPVQLPEGTTVKYVLSAKAKNGKVWSKTGTTQVWTLKQSSPTGFQPASLVLDDELGPGGG